MLLLLLVACADPSDTAAAATLVLGPPQGITAAADDAGEESALSNFQLHLSRVEIGRADRIGMEWVTLYDGKSDVWEVDLISGEGDELVVEIPEGEWDHLVLELAGYAWLRAGADCTWQESVEDLTGVVTTGDVAASYGQLFSPSGVPLNPPATPPSAVYSDANDEMFWHLSGPISVEPGETQSAWLSAPAQGSIVETHPCDESPGKPSFSLDVGTAAYHEICLLADPLPAMVNYMDPDGWGAEGYPHLTPESHCAGMGGEHLRLEEDALYPAWSDFLGALGYTQVYWSDTPLFTGACLLEYTDGDQRSSAGIINHLFSDSDGEYVTDWGGGRDFAAYCEGMRSGEEPYAEYLSL